MPQQISGFLESLKRTPRGMFNPWFHRDKKHDISPAAPEIRRKQFEQYLAERQTRAKYLLIAEALGYQGGHFTGIAMTSERILLGYQESKYGVKPDHVFRSIKPERTSKPEFIEKGMTEPTATIMWGAITKLGIDPYEVVLWNAVPWHPYKKEKGILSNRTPTEKEIRAGITHLQSFIRLFGDTKIIAVGKKCEQSLLELGIEHDCVRHPANGGAPEFRMQFKGLIKK